MTRKIYLYLRTRLKSRWGKGDINETLVPNDSLEWQHDTGVACVVLPSPPRKDLYKTSLFYAREGVSSQKTKILSLWLGLFEFVLFLYLTLLCTHGGPWISSCRPGISSNWDPLGPLIFRESLSVLVQSLETQGEGEGTGWRTWNGGIYTKEYRRGVLHKKREEMSFLVKRDVVRVVWTIHFLPVRVFQEARIMESCSFEEFLCSCRVRVNVSRLS